MTDSEFQEFLIAKENNFEKITEMGKVIVNHYKWYDTFHNLQWYAYFNHKKILYSRNLKDISKTLEIVDLLISEKLSTLAIHSEN